MQEEISELRKKGYSREQIKEIIGCSSFTLSKYLPGAYPSKIGQEIISLHEEGKTFLEIVGFGYSKSTISKWLKGKKKNSTPVVLKPKNSRPKESHSSKWRREIRRKRLAFVREIFNNQCQKCGYNICQSALHFHHLKNKQFAISGSRKIGMPRLLDEVKKCCLLCANCHAEVHEGLWDTDTLTLVVFPDIHEVPQDLIRPPGVRLSSEQKEKENAWIEKRKSEIQIQKEVLKTEKDINLKEVRLKEVPRSQIQDLFKKHHYLGASHKGSFFNLGLFTEEELIGCALITNPVRQGSEGYLEISRFLLLSNNKNLGSKFLSLIIQFIKTNYSCKGVQSFSDDSVHSGTIYKAANFKLQDRKFKTYNYDGIHKKTIYQRALMYEMSEHEYAKEFGLARVPESPKSKYTYNF